MNKTTFFAYARRAPFGGRLSQAQVDGTSAILAEAAKRRLPDKYTAYVLATAFHETGGKMQPVKEKGSYKYLSKYDTGRLAKVLGNTPAADGDGQRYAGRGLVQITGRSNYRKFGIEATPDAALEPKTAIRIMFDGMLEGKFTGRKLADYFGAGREDPEGARRIVNGTDKASLIAGYYRNFLDSINAAREMKPAAVEDAKPDDVPLLHDKTVRTIVAAGGGTFVTGLIGAVSNPWAFATVALIVVVLGGGFWLWKSGRLELKREA